MLSPLPAGTQPDNKVEDRRRAEEDDKRKAGKSADTHLKEHHADYPNSSLQARIRRAAHNTGGRPTRRLIISLRRKGSTHGAVFVFTFSKHML